MRRPTTLIPTLFLSASLIGGGALAQSGAGPSRAAAPNSPQVCAPRDGQRQACPTTTQPGRTNAQPGQERTTPAQVNSNDLKRNAPSSDDHEQWIVEPLQAQLPARVPRPVFIAAVLSEGQYQYQISNCPVSGTTLLPEHVEFNYFTSRREATAWLGDN